MVLANGATVAQNLPYTPTLIAGANSYTIRNVVTCQTKLTLAKTVQGGTDRWQLDPQRDHPPVRPPDQRHSGSAGATGPLSPPA